MQDAAIYAPESTEETQQTETTDAALFGGYLPWTEYRDAVDRRVHPFDSIAVSGHKFFGMDEPAGFFLTTLEIKDNQNPYNVTYLTGSMPMITCSRSAVTP